MQDEVALYAYLSYADAPAGIDWLSALGFTTVTRQDGDDGSVQHCEMRLGNAVVMVASFDADYQRLPVRGRSTGGGLYLFTDDVDVLYEMAITAGATELFPPESTEWGTRRARVLDPGGNEWSFGSYQPGQSWT